MATYNARIKGIDALLEYRGPDQCAVYQVSFDLVAQATTGGTDTITLGGGGYNEGQNVGTPPGQSSSQATTQTLAQIIAARIRGAGGTFTIVGVMGGPPGLQAGSKLFATGMSVSTGNVTGVAIQTALSGGSAQSTTSATWDSAASVIVNGYFTNVTD